jgi:hypothetical protein
MISTMSNKRHVPSPLEGFPDEGFYTLQAESRRRELFLRGLTTRSPRRHQAFVFLGCWLLFVAMIVAILVVVYG